MTAQTEANEYTPGTQFLVVQPLKGPKTFVEAPSQKDVERITQELEENGQKVIMSTTSKQEAVDKVNEALPVSTIRGPQGSSI